MDILKYILEKGIIPIVTAVFVVVISEIIKNKDKKKVERETVRGELYKVYMEIEELQLKTIERMLFTYRGDISIDKHEDSSYILELLLETNRIYKEKKFTSEDINIARKFYDVLNTLVNQEYINEESEELKISLQKVLDKMYDLIDLKDMERINLGNMINKL